MGEARELSAPGAEARWLIRTLLWGRHHLSPLSSSSVPSFFPFYCSRLLWESSGVTYQWGYHQVLKTLNLSTPSPCIP